MSHVDSHAITHVSLCTGYGGIDLGLKRVLGKRLVTVAACEIEAFATANLVSKAEAGLLDNAPIWSDLKRFPWGKFHGLVDILSGGYPCQPFSAAGKRLGKEDPRHLWPHIADGIAAMRPSVCFFENVEGHISLGLPDVIEDLAGMGYRTTWGIFSASEVGAPHQRKRVFIMAHRINEGSQGLRWDVNDRSESRWNGEEEKGSVGASSICVWPSRPGEPQHEWEPPRVVGNAERILLPASREHRAMEQEGGNATREGSQPSQAGAESGASRKREGSGADASERNEAQPSLGGNANGPSCGVDYAELQDSDDSDCGACAEHGGELGDSEYDGLHGSEVGRGFEEASNDFKGWAKETIQSSGASESNCGSNLYTDLYTSCDNRTDELRLLGNGVVPSTAELAFRTLWEELTA